MFANFSVFIGAAVLLIALILFIKPLRGIFKIIVNSALGAVMLLLWNIFGAGLNLYIGVNIYTALTVGILGLPGFILLLVMKWFFR